MVDISTSLGYAMMLAAVLGAFLGYRLARTRGCGIAKTLLWTLCLGGVTMFAVGGLSWAILDLFVFR